MVAAPQPRRSPNSFLGPIPAPCPLLPNSLKSSCPIPLLSSRWIAPVSLLKSTLVNSLASVENKGLIETLTPLESTLTKNRGGGVIIANQVPVHQERSKGITGTFRPSRKKPSLPLASLGVSNFRVEGSAKRLASF